MIGGVQSLHRTLCNPVDCSIPVFPVLHYLLEFAQTHAIHPSPPLPASLTTFSSCPRSFPAPVSFYSLWIFIHRKKSEDFFFLPFHLNSSRPIDLNIASAQPTLQMHQEDKRQQRELISILIKGTGMGSGGWKRKDSSIWWDQGFNLFWLKRALRNRFLVGAPHVWNKGHPPPTLCSDGSYSL